MAFQNTIITSTSPATIISSQPGLFTDLLWLIITNTSATGTRVDITNTGSAVTCSLWSPPTSSLPLFFMTGAIPAATSGGSWTATCSAAVTDIRIFVNFLTHT